MQFSELGLKPSPSVKKFVGDKIKMEKILGKQISVLSYEIQPSKAFPEKGDGNYIKMQIEFNGEKRLVFTSGTVLMDLIKKVPEDAFPFTTTIVKNEDHFEFT